MDLGKELRVIEVEEEVVTPSPIEIEPPIRVEDQSEKSEQTA
jgi:hypothetical protein